MKIYAKYNGEVCELRNYKASHNMVTLLSPTEGPLRVKKHRIEIVGFRNGKGDTGELKILK